MYTAIIRDSISDTVLTDNFACATEDDAYAVAAESYPGYEVIYVFERPKVIVTVIGSGVTVEKVGDVDVELNGSIVTIPV